MKMNVAISQISLVALKAAGAQAVETALVTVRKEVAWLVDFPNTKFVSPGLGGAPQEWGSAVLSDVSSRLELAKRDEIRLKAALEAAAKYPALHSEVFWIEKAHGIGNGADGCYAAFVTHSRTENGRVVVNGDKSEVRMKPHSPGPIEGFWVSVYRDTGKPVEFAYGRYETPGAIPTNPVSSQWVQAGYWVRIG